MHQKNASRMFTNYIFSLSKAIQHFSILLNRHIFFKSAFSQKKLCTVSRPSIKKAMNNILKVCTNFQLYANYCKLKYLF